MPFYCFLWLWRALSLSLEQHTTNQCIRYACFEDDFARWAWARKEFCAPSISGWSVPDTKCRYGENSSSSGGERLEIIGRMTGAFSQKRKILLLINLINSFCGACCCEGCGFWSDVFLNLRGNQYLMVLVLMKNVVWNFGREINIRFYLFSFNLVVWNSIIKDHIAPANKKNPDILELGSQTHAILAVYQQLM